MHTTFLVRSLLAGMATLALLGPSGALAAGVRPLFDLDSPATAPFPTDRFTLPDTDQLTGRRVDLPAPDCATYLSECQDVDVLNTLDGFNLQPRLSIPFSGPIDVTSVNSSTIFLVRLGTAVDGRGRDDGHQVVGLNQIVWDPATNTLHAESDELLDQHTRYLLVVTDGVRDADGDPVESGDFARFRHHQGQAKDPTHKDYRRELARALAGSGVHATRIVAASVFTTQSATAVLEKIRDQIKAISPAPADFRIGLDGRRAVFPLDTVKTILFTRQASTAPTFAAPSNIRPALGIIPNAIGQVAFGKYASADYETPGKYIPSVATRTGTPAAQGTNDVYFTLYLPAGSQPPAGWPVAIFGHGITLDRHVTPAAVAAVMAAHGFATVSINAVGHGGGPLGTLTIARADGTEVMLPAGGRGIDQDGNGTIDAFEGLSAAPPRTIISYRDGLRQTVADLMQLVRVIETGGMDVDGDGFADLDGSRIYYFGQSLGGIYGTLLIAIDPSVRAGVPNVPGGSLPEVGRLSPAFRPLVGLTLATRAPSLINVGGLTFNENLPLRDQAPVVDTVAGAAEIQEFLDRAEWVSQAGNAVAYAPHVRKAPLPGVSPKPVIYQFAKGDQTVPNPTTSAILRAGELADRATYFRNDLAYAAFPGSLKNPHLFLVRIDLPAVAPFAIAAQQQIAMFFASDGELVLDPDGDGPYFEVPIDGPLPEELSFIP